MPKLKQKIFGTLALFLLVCLGLFQATSPAWGNSPIPDRTFLSAFENISPDRRVVIGEILSVTNDTVYSTPGRSSQYPELEIRVDQVLFGSAEGTIRVFGKNTFVFEGDMWVPKIITGGVWALPGDQVLLIIKEHDSWDSKGDPITVSWARRILFVEEKPVTENSVLSINSSSANRVPLEGLSDRNTILAELLKGISRKFQRTEYTISDIRKAISVGTTNRKTKK